MWFLEANSVIFIEATYEIFGSYLCDFLEATYVFFRIYLCDYYRSYLCNF